MLPGLGPTATIAMLLPVTFTLPPVSALIMLAGIYYGSQYGGSTTSILVNLPGEASSVVTTLDGYQMARQGRAGVALATAAIGSFFAGTVATFLIAAVRRRRWRRWRSSSARPSTSRSWCWAWSPRSCWPRARCCTPSAWSCSASCSDWSAPTSRPAPSASRSSIPQLADGIGFVVVAMGMFGLGEIVRNLDHEEAGRTAVTKITSPDADPGGLAAHGGARSCAGTAIGSALGILPGSGSILGAFAAYSIEKKVSRNRAEFGKGAIEGVAAPESANNAGAQTSFIPMLTLGIPSNPVMALMIGAMIIQGIQPGPSVITEQPALFWGIIVSMWIGNLFLVILNLPMIGLWVRLIMVPYHLLYPSILVFCAIGVFSLNNSEFDVYLMALFGVAGLRARAARVRAGADAARLHPGAADGGVPAAGDAALAREPLGPRPAPHQRGPCSRSPSLAMGAVLLPAFGRTPEAAEAF